MVKPLHPGMNLELEPNAVWRSAKLGKRVLEVRWKGQGEKSIKAWTGMTPPTHGRAPLYHRRWPTPPASTDTGTERLRYRRSHGTLERLGLRANVLLSPLIRARKRPPAVEGMPAVARVPSSLGPYRGASPPPAARPSGRRLLYTRGMACTPSLHCSR